MVNKNVKNMAYEGENSRRVCVVGGGYWGKNLIRNFHELGALRAICDSNELLRENYEEKYAGIKFTTSFEEIIRDDKIEAVALASPAITHYRLGLEAIKAGKHLFVEKPLALAVADGEEMISAARLKGVVLMVGHILQYHNAVLKLKELIDQGELGKVQYICSNRLSIGKIRAEENILWSFAPHDISVILMLMNEEPDEVYAAGGAYLQQKVSDVTLTVMGFPSGVKAHIFVSWLHPFKEQKLVVVGDEKMAVFDDVSENKLMLYPHKVEWVQRTPVARKAEAEVVPVESKEPLKAECMHFLECVSEGKRPKTDGEEGLRVLKVLEASQRSLDKATGKGKSEKLQDVQSGAVEEKRDITDYFIHESSYLDDGIEIGSGTKIWHFSHVLKGSKIGKNCNIGQNVVIGPDAQIGNGCKIQSNVSVYTGVILEDEVFCGPSMVFTNVYNPRAHIRRMHEVRPTLVKKGATLGANCTIVCGHNIGRYAFIGAGAVVTRDVPDYALMLGNPAKIKGWMCACGIRLNFIDGNAVCKTCGAKYQKIDAENIREI